MTEAQEVKRFAAVIRGVAAGVLCGVPVPTTTPLAAAPQERATSETTTRVAVLVFSNVTGGGADDWMGVGIAETVATGLDGVSGLRVGLPLGLGSRIRMGRR